MAQVSPEASSTQLNSEGGDAVAWKLPPLRPLSDFILDSARFQWPDTKTPGKWKERVRKNLLYYEGNYILSIVIVLLLYSVLRPDFWTGVGVALSFYCLGGLTFGSLLAGWRKDFPEFRLILVLINAKIVYDYCSYLLTLFYLVLVIVTLVLIHASMRMRNIRNKLFTFKEKTKKKHKTLLRAILNKIDSTVEDYERQSAAGAQVAMDAYTVTVNRGVEGINPTLTQQRTESPRQTQENVD